MVISFFNLFPLLTCFSVMSDFNDFLSHPFFIYIKFLKPTWFLRKSSEKIFHGELMSNIVCRTFYMHVELYLQCRYICKKMKYQKIYFQPTFLFVKFKLPHGGLILIKIKAGVDQPTGSKTITLLGWEMLKVPISSWSSRLQEIQDWSKMVLVTLKALCVLLVSIETLALTVWFTEPVPV